MKIYKSFKSFSLIVMLLISISCKDNFDYEYSTDPIIKVNPSEYPLGVSRISSDSLAFKLYAPGKSEVYLIGDFSKWEKLNMYKMVKEQDTDIFFLKIGRLNENQEYICQYLIDNNIRVGDPYANKTSDPLDKYISSDNYNNMLSYPSGANNEIAMVVSTSQKKYNWQVSNFKTKNPSNLVIYEMLIRDFTGEDNTIGNIKNAKSKIPYLKELGITAIELMPFNEFEGNESWGYNPTYYFAPDKAYGNANDYKDFIDECHKNGIAVIMDMVLNHAYGQCPLAKMYLKEDGKVNAENPYFNVESPNQDYGWGYDFNHESTYTQQFVDSVCSYWMSEFKVDGFRFDFTKGFTQTPGNGWAYDEARINILKRMSSEIWRRNPEAIVIMEHLADNSEEKVLADYGIYLWGNMNGNFNESTMGYGGESGDYGLKGDISWASYLNRNWSKPTLVAYMESHDEERLMYKNEQWGNSLNSYNVKSITTGLERNAAATAIYMTIPGPKMIWQFGELGYDISIDQNGRTGLKPTGWYLLDEPNRVALKDTYQKMIRLKNSIDAFKTTNYDIDLQGNLKQVLLKSNDKYVCTIANLDMEAKTINVNFGKTGTWVEQFSNVTTTVSNAITSITLQPGEFRVYISN